jgi:hypothetical protein
LSPLESDSDLQPRSRSAAFSWALALFAALIGFGGLAMILGMGFVLAQNPTVNKDVPVALLVFGSLSFVGIFAVLVYMVLRLAGTSPTTAKQSKARARRRRETSAPQIEPPPLTMNSVTEHTTRTFQPLKRESNALD